MVITVPVAGAVASSTASFPWDTTAAAMSAGTMIWASRMTVAAWMSRRTAQRQKPMADVALARNGNGATRVLGVDLGTPRRDLHGAVPPSRRFLDGVGGYERW